MKVYRRVFGRARPGSSLVYTYLAISFAENVVVLGRTDTRAIRSFAGVSPCTPAVSISAGNNAVDGSYSRGPPFEEAQKRARRCTYARFHGYTWLEFSPIRIRYSTLLVALSTALSHYRVYGSLFNRSASAVGFTGNSRSGRKDLILRRDRYKPFGHILFVIYT